MQNRDDEAKAVLEKVHSRSGTGHDRAHTELYQIQKQVAIDRELNCTWVQLFRKPSYRKRAWYAIGTTGIVQFAGVLVINSNSTPTHLPPLPPRGCVFDMLLTINQIMAQSSTSSWDMDRKNSCSSP